MVSELGREGSPWAAAWQRLESSPSTHRFGRGVAVSVSLSLSLKQTIDSNTEGGAAVRWEGEIGGFERGKQAFFSSALMYQQSTHSFRTFAL